MKGSRRRLGESHFPQKTNTDGLMNRDRQRPLREMLVYFLLSVAMARRSKALRASPLVLGEVPRGRILGGGATAADPRFKSEMTRVARASCWSMASLPGRLLPATALFELLPFRDEAPPRPLFSGCAAICTSLQLSSRYNWKRSLKRKMKMCPIQENNRLAYRVFRWRRFLGQLDLEVVSQTTRT